VCRTGRLSDLSGAKADQEKALQLQKRPVSTDLSRVNKQVSGLEVGHVLVYSSFAQELLSHIRIDSHRDKLASSIDCLQ
jgi:hypothetical protein